MAEPEYDVFISYRWKDPDQSWVRESLVPALQRSGLRVLLDVEDFVPGRDLMLEMSRANRDSRRLLCVLSPDYFDGERMVHFESLMARRADPSGARSALIPLILRPVELPEWMRGLVPVDWSSAASRPREWRKLLKALGASGSTPPPAAPRDELPAADAVAEPEVEFHGPALPRSLSKGYTLTGLHSSGPLNQIFQAKDDSGKPLLIKRVGNKDAYHKASIEKIADVYRGASGRRRAVLPLSITEDRDAFYEVLEYVPGWTLIELMNLAGQQGVIGRLLEQWANELLRSIQPLHDAGYVHRDVSPYNVLVSAEDLSLVLIDFSGAVPAAQAARISPLFSPGYSAPEQLDGRFGTFNDVYSVGALLVYLNHCEPPPPLETRRLSNPSVSLRGAVYYKLNEAVERMLELDPAERPQSAGEALREIVRKGTTERYRPAIEGLLSLPDGRRVGMGYHRWTYQ